MKQPSHDETRMIAAIAAQYPEFVAWLGEWRREELERLPYVTSPAVSQGRCQTLTELHKLCTKATEYAANLPRRS